MATQEKTWNVANRLHSLKDSDNPEVNHIIAGADEIYDDAKGAKQSDINAQTDAALAERYTKSETYSKEQLDSLITTPDANYVTVATFADLPQTGEANTIYRVSSYDGTQVDASKYALYAWNGATYQLLAVRSAVGEVFDVSEYNSGATYETLATALAAVPTSVQRGGMSIKFVQSSDNKYVQYRLMITTWSTTVSDWQGVDSEPTAGSENLIKSGDVYQGLVDVGFDVNIEQGSILSDTGTTYYHPTRIRTGIFLKAPVKVETTGNYLSKRYTYGLDGTYIGSEKWATKDVVTDKTKLYKFLFKANDDSDITPADAMPYIKIYNGLRYNIDYLGEKALRADLEQSFSTLEKALLQSNMGLDERLSDDNLIYIKDVISANLHNSADVTPASSPEPTDGSDWAGHHISTRGVPGTTSFDYNLTYYIPVHYGTDYKCTKEIRRLCFFDQNNDFVSPCLESIVEEAAIVVPPTAKTCRFMYVAQYTPDSVRFGRYQDDINVPYSSKKIDYDALNRRIALYDETELLKQKVITSIGSSGFDVNCGGQYCLTETQKQTYDVTNDLCVTRVVQKLLGYDKANVCAYSGVPASLIFFKNGSSPLILKNSVTLISGTAVPYTFDLTTIAAPMTENLTVLETSDIGTFSGILNGYNVTVNAVSGTITLNDVTPANVVIPAGAMLYRNVYTRTTAGSSTVTTGLKGSTGLILQIGANSEGATPEEIFGYCELAIKESGCKWFVVLRKNTQGNLDYDTAETTGGSDLNKASKLLRAKYGSMFIDHMAYMTSRKSLSDQGITPTTSAQYPDENGQNSNPLTQQQIDHNIPCDMECIATRRVPSSFWYGAWREDDVPTNEGHFNAQGLECLGKYIYTMVHRMGF